MQRYYARRQYWPPIPGLPPWARNRQDVYKRQINLIMREKLSGIRVIRAFGTEDYEEKRFDGANKDLMNNAMKMRNT